MFLQMFPNTLYVGWKAARWAKKKTFDVGWRACQLKRMVRSLYFLQSEKFFESWSRNKCHRMIFLFFPSTLRQSQKKNDKINDNVEDFTS